MIFCCLIKIPSRFANDCTWFEIFTLKQNTRPAIHKTRSRNLGVVILQEVYVVLSTLPLFYILPMAEKITFIW